MKKYRITITETVSQDFYIEAEDNDTAIDLAEELYKDGTLVLEPGDIQAVDFEVFNETDNENCGTGSIY